MPRSKIISQKTVFLSSFLMERKSARFSKVFKANQEVFNSRRHYILKKMLSRSFFGEVIFNLAIWLFCVKE